MGWTDFLIRSEDEQKEYEAKKGTAKDRQRAKRIAALERKRKELAEAEEDRAYENEMRGLEQQLNEARPPKKAGIKGRWSRGSKKLVPAVKSGWTKFQNYAAKVDASAKRRGNINSSGYKIGTYRDPFSNSNRRRSSKDLLKL